MLRRHCMRSDRRSCDRERSRDDGAALPVSQLWPLPLWQPWRAGASGVCANSRFSLRFDRNEIRSDGCITSQVIHPAAMDRISIIREFCPRPRGLGHRGTPALADVHVPSSPSPLSAEGRRYTSEVCASHLSRKMAQQRLDRSGSRSNLLTV